MSDDFADFYRAQYPLAVRLAWLLTHDHASAEDITQDAFVRVRPRLTTVEHPTAYLRQAIVNGCRDRARGAGRSVTRMRLVSAGVESWTTDRPAELIDAVGGLPYKQRLVIVLRYWADLPESEIAAIVGVRPNTVRSLAARALAQLRKEIPDGN
jgi:RNA polymerase sigma factor (sigma-70 family)